MQNVRERARARECVDLATGPKTILATAPAAGNPAASEPVSSFTSAMCAASSPAIDAAKKQKAPENYANETTSKKMKVVEFDLVRVCARARVCVCDLCAVEKPKPTCGSGGGSGGIGSCGVGGVVGVVGGVGGSSSRDGSSSSSNILPFIACAASSSSV
jgi:hypothetical protein